MRKKLLFILTLVFLFSLTLLNINVNAESSVTVETVQGAEIRTSSPSGLRFTGVVTGDWASLGSDVLYGFLLSKGTFTKDEMISKLASGKAIASPATNVNEYGEFYLTIINIPAMGYEKNITALAYVEVDGVKYYSEQSITRNILQVAKTWSEDPEYPGNEFNDRIINTSTFILNGGIFSVSNSLSIGAYNSGYTGKYGITLCTKDVQTGESGQEDIGSGKYWYKAALKQIDLDSNLYTIVQTVVSGNTLDTTLDYDYVIAAWENDGTNYSALKKACDNNEYLYFSSLAAGANVLFANNYEIFLGNKVYIAQNESLPLAYKDYYSFAGWYDNDSFTGDAVSIHPSEIAITYYAKFNPILYAINVDLQGGTCSVEIPTTYNYESSEIILPTASEMTIDNGSFIGWYDNATGTGDPITKIATNSTGDITLYAVWEMETINELSITNVDIDVLNSKIPNIIVNSSLSIGNYSLKGNGLSDSYSDVVYKYNVNAFSTISEALSVANTNDAIYVMAGTYTDDLTVSTTGLYIYGPNYGVSANDISPTRNAEAVISSVVNISASNVVVDGIKLTGNSYINIDSSATNLRIKNIYSDSAGMSVAGSGGNRMATIYAAASCTDITICDSYFNVGSATYCRDAITLYGTAKDITIERNYITNSTTSSSTSEAIQFGTASGTIIIKDNSIIYPTGNCVLYMVSGTAKIDIINNIISGKSSALYTSTIRLTSGQSGGVVNIIGNDFSYVEPNTFNLASTVAGHILNVKYNYFNGKKYQITNLGSGTINYASNYYTETQTTATSDAGVITSLDTLITAYKSSDEYVANGNICVYENKLNANNNINNTISELDLIFSSITNVNSNLTLPTANDTYGTTITWATSDKDALSSAGVYGTPDKDTTVTLTATVTYQGVYSNCSFDVIVKAYYKDLSNGIASGYFYYSQSSIDTYTYTNLDIMYIAFAKISADGSISNYSTVVSNCKSKVATAHQYGTRVIISIQQTTALSDFVTVASSTELINTFADNLVKLINEVGFDGVDMDWEWPSSTNAPLFTSLMKIVYEKVKANNKYHLVTAALGGYQASRYDLNNSKQYLDYINLMTYDLHLSSASFHNGLYNSSAGNSSYTCNGAVTSYLNYVTADKLVLGIPFYGREFTGCTGLKTGSYNAARTYTYICNNYLDTTEHIALYRNWDSSAKVPYIFDSTNGIIISYEDEESIGYKSDYAKEKGLAGLMYWVDSQDYGNALLQTIVDSVRSW